jgi:hypothetical protein
VLTGSVAASTAGNSLQLTPTIVLFVDDPSIAAMTSDELRKRLRLLVEGATWCAHWNDGELTAAADAAARAKAAEALDWLDDSGQLDAMPVETRRETLLHLKAKEILEREGRIRLPDLPVEATAILPDGETLRKQVCLPGPIVQLASVTLEKHLGPIKPDVLATTIAVADWPADQLLIEVTVTNTISDERLERIRRMNIPAIEVDISRMGGRVTEAEFARLVVDEQAGKRWLHHPRREQAERRERLARIPVSDLAKQYLQAVQEHADIRASAEEYGAQVSPAVVKAALDRVKACAEGLAIHGYPEAEEDLLFRQKGNLLERLLSLKQDKAVGCQIKTAWQVINSIMAEHARQAGWHALYLTAIEVYQPTMTADQRDKYLKWRDKVKQSIDQIGGGNQRNIRFDRLLSLLFPELAEPLGKLLTMEAARAPKQASPKTASHAAYEQWKRENPEWAKAWEARSTPTEDKD